jgi:hypothetical protein
LRDKSCVGAKMWVEAGSRSGMLGNNLSEAVSAEFLLAASGP